MSREATEQRLRTRGFARLEPDEQIVTWCRVWVSKAGRFQRLAPRWRDVAVITDRRLLCKRKVGRHDPQDATGPTRWRLPF